MKAMIRTGMAVIAVLVLCLPTAAAVKDLRDSLLPENISGVRVNLIPQGAQLGFEIEVTGDDPWIEALATVIREAIPGGGHRCANAGAIRFKLRDGRVIGVGLLPSHADGFYGLRLYDGGQYVAVYRVDRAALLAVLEGLGVPMDDPAFRE